jgi:hypothetical protein
MILNYGPGEKTNIGKLIKKELTKGECNVD